MTLFVERTRQRADAGGTADFTFANNAPPPAYKTWLAGIPDASEIFYCAVSGTQYEVGTSAWNAGGNTFARQPLDTSDTAIGDSPVLIDFIAAPDVFSVCPGYYMSIIDLYFNLFAGIASAITADGNGNITHSAAIADTADPFPVVITGFNETIPDNTSSYTLVPAAGLATGTLKMPANPIDGQQVYIGSTKTVAALTHTANTGQTLINPLTTLVAGTTYIKKFRASDNTWTP